MLDAFMVRASPFVKMFVFDGESCNNVLRNAIHGTLDATLRRKLLSTEFFSQLNHAGIPGFEALPRLPIKHCTTDSGRSLYALCGAAHAMKNACGQLMSSGRVLFFGRHYADAAGALAHGLPLPAFGRKDAMSDRLCALLCNPLFLAPAVCSGMTLEERCEISLSGLIVQDLWKLLGVQREHKDRLPKGLCTMAPQTLQNMQLIAMTTANICATKEDTFHPWKGAAHSMSEIHIERMFGRYRGQYHHSDLTTRGYWNANARVAKQQVSKLSRSKISAPRHEKEPALTPGQLRACVQRALNSALLLASKCSDVTVHELERLYRVESGMDFFQCDDAPCEEMLEEMEAEDVEVREQDARKNEVSKVLSEIQEVAEDEFAEDEADSSHQPQLDPDANLPDGKILIDLTAADDSGDPSGPSVFPDFPRTLSEALLGDGNLWGRLWQLATKLRCGTDGMDTLYLRKAEQAENETLSGQRASRMARSGSVVALNLGDGLAPCAAIILTLWNLAKKPKPCGQECTLKAAHAFRAVLLRASEENPSEFSATQSVSKFIPEQVIAILDVEDGDLTVGKLTLTEGSGTALAKLMAADLPSVPPLAERCGRRGRGRKRKAGTAVNMSFKHVQKNLRERAKSKSEGHDGGSKPPSEQTFEAADFRRSVKGRKAMSYAVQRLVDLDRLVFPNSPLFDPQTQMCTQKGLADLSVQDVTNRAPIVFQQQYFQIRSPDQFGERVFLKDFASSLSLAVPVESLYTLRLRCQKLHGSVAKAWTFHLGEADEVSLQKWQQSMLKMSVSDGLRISRTAFLAAMRASAIDASNTILELLQRTRSLFPVSAAFESHPFPRHPLDQNAFAEAVAPILQRCRAASQIFASSEALREERTAADLEAILLFNYLDVYSEDRSLGSGSCAKPQRDFMAMFCALTRATPSSSIYRWQKRQARLQGRSTNRGDFRETVSTMPSVGDGDSSDSHSESTSRPTTMGSRGTVRLPGSRGNKDRRLFIEFGGLEQPFEYFGCVSCPMAMAQHWSRMRPLWSSGAKRL
eukprot:s2243_g6.t1